MDYALKVLVPPEVEPVSLEEMKAWFRLDNADSDLVLTLLAQAMREDAEHFTGRAFIQRQMLLTIPAFEVDSEYGYRVTLPYPPLRTVDSFEYLDGDGQVQTLDPAKYSIQSADDESCAYMIPASGQSWPALQKRPDAVQITFTAGYPSGSPADDAGLREFVPAKVKLWIEAKARTMEQFREQLVAGNVVAIPRNFTDALLDSLIVRKRFA